MDDSSQLRNGTAQRIDGGESVRQDDGEIKVSVCCLAYNHEKYIRHTLEGFVRQKTSFKFEVLIHDDASTDGTAAIIREYEEKYPELIKPIYQKKNQYSKGVRIGSVWQYPRAKGKYFAFCEGDDYWCDCYKLQKQYEAMEAHPECSICVHKVAVINEDGSWRVETIPRAAHNLYMNWKEGIIDEAKLAKAMWCTGYPFHTSSYFERKDVIDSIRSENRFAGFNGDEQHIHNAFCKGSFYYIENIMSARRRLSIGSYCWRAQRMSRHERWKEWQKTHLKPMSEFNEYTGGKYSQYINQLLIRCLLNNGTYEPKEVVQILQRMGVTFANVRKLKGKSTVLRYLFVRYFRLGLLLFRIYDPCRAKISSRKK